MMGMGLMTASHSAPPAAPADTIYFGGDIVTINDKQPTAEAVAVKDGKLLAVGSLAEIENANKGPAEGGRSWRQDLAACFHRCAQPLHQFAPRRQTIYPVAAGVEKPLTDAQQNAAKTYSWRAEVCDMAGLNQAAHKQWTLTTLNGKEIVAEKPPTMKFEHGKLSVFGGINRLSGSYALVDNTVTMGSLVSTKMAGDPALMELEGNLAKALASVDAFQVSGDELMLSNKGTVVATFRSGQ